MNAYFKGLPISGPRGPAGPDGNPTGTIISFMGLTAPKDYLVCDGAEYPVADYPELAAFFREQFGSANHFGGDGETTFAVPDMRNLFLRGFHGEAEEQLSGEIGQRQEATRHVRLSNAGGSTFAIMQPRNDLPSSYNTEEADSNIGPAAYIGYAGESSTLYPNSTFTHYTARPVNMAVLYCIKAVESVPENSYSTDEVRIGTWIDGKPIYRKTTVSAVPGGNGTIVAENVQEVTRAYGLAKHVEQIITVPYYKNLNDRVSLKKNGTTVSIVSAGFDAYNITMTIEYTKITD